jgi:biopolymer transport protein ExbD
VDRSRASAILAAMLALGGCGEEEPAPVVTAEAPAGTPRLVGRAEGPVPWSIDLRRAGTIGDLPPEPMRGVLALDAEGNLALDGDRVEFADLRVRLAALHGDPSSREPDGSSRLDLLVAADRLVPWRAVTWLLQAAASPRARIYRVHFAVLPDEGTEVGSLANFLPWDRQDPAAPARTRLVTVAMTAQGGYSPASLYRAMREKRVPPLAELAADPGASHGDVIGVLDALLGRGFLMCASGPRPRPGRERHFARSRSRRELRCGGRRFWWTDGRSTRVSRTPTEGSRIGCRPWRGSWGVRGDRGSR